jgi:hypothetical protein
MMGKRFMPGTYREPDDEAGEGWESDETDEWVKPCPYCGQEMYDDAPRCPSCGCYVSAEDAVVQPKPAWILITAVIVLVMMLAWLANYF